MSGAIDRSPKATVERTHARCKALADPLPAEFKAREDALPARIRSEDASAQSKLGRIYALVDEFSAVPGTLCRARGDARTAAA